MIRLSHKIARRRFGLWLSRRHTRCPLLELHPYVNRAGGLWRPEIGISGVVGRFYFHTSIREQRRAA
jgi:hypothetical protein